MLSPRSTIVASKDLISRGLHEEEVILHLKSGVYYGLDDIGGRIWQMIREPRSVNDILDAIQNEYEVQPEQCERDVLPFLEKLAVEGLIEIKDETNQ